MSWHSSLYTSNLPFPGSAGFQERTGGPTKLRSARGDEPAREDAQEVSEEADAGRGETDG